MKCAQCHTTAEKSERAVFPDASQCRACHPEYEQQKPFALARITRIPDFVFFSHARHHSAKVNCTACHGEVEKQETLAQQFTMKFCVDCHKAQKATITCTACHELTQ
ncbi:MAG: cytochrome c3 family protein [Bryobacteraceae bacterium]